MKSFQSFSTPTILDEASGLLLTEADTSASTNAEFLFVHLWNYFNGPEGNKIKTADEFLKVPWRLNSKDKNLQELKRFWKAAAGKKKGVSMPTDEVEASDLFFNLYQAMKRQGNWSGTAEQSGKSYLQLSAYWDSMASKSTDASKADIMIGGVGISVKNGKGARLMSGQGEEAKATIETAIVSGNVGKGVASDLNVLVDQFTNPRIFLQKNVPGLDNIETLTLGKFKKIIADPEKVKLFNEANLKAMEEYKKGVALRSSVETAKIIKKHFNSSDSTFARHWAYEAGSGAEKFSAEANMPEEMFGDFTAKGKDSAGDKSGQAKWMLAFSPDLTQLKCSRMSSPSDKVVKTIASQSSIRFDFKSGRDKVSRHANQTMQSRVKTSFTDIDNIVKVGDKIAQEKEPQTESYQTMCDYVISELNEMQNLSESVFTEADKWHRMLNEGLITEWKWWDKVKKMASTLLDGIKKAWSRINEVIDQMAEDFRSAINAGYKAVLGYVGIEMTNIKVKTKGFNLL